MNAIPDTAALERAIADDLKITRFKSKPEIDAEKMPDVMRKQAAVLEQRIAETERRSADRHEEIVLARKAEIARHAREMQRLADEDAAQREAAERAVAADRLSLSRTRAYLNVE